MEQGEKEGIQITLMRKGLGDFLLGSGAWVCRILGCQFQDVRLEDDDKRREI